jgi:hypothetical protein
MFVLSNDSFPLVQVWPFNSTWWVVSRSAELTPSSLNPIFGWNFLDFWKFPSDQNCASPYFQLCSLKFLFSVYCPGLDWPKFLSWYRPECELLIHSRAKWPGWPHLKQTIRLLKLPFWFRAGMCPISGFRPVLFKVSFPLLSIRWSIRVFNSSSLIVKVLGLVPISGFNPASLKLLVCLVSEGFLPFNFP